jgi:multidrug resistance efflux pump
VLEPLVQQAAVPPFKGYIREASMRAGDIVERGVLLASLDDKELRLDRLKLLGQQEELNKQLRAAMAEHNNAQLPVLGTQLDQVRVQLTRTVIDSTRPSTVLRISTIWHASIRQ